MNSVSFRIAKKKGKGGKEKKKKDEGFLCLLIQVTTGNSFLPEVIAVIPKPQAK